ncbi:hypothetical protein V3C99_017702 [Haemonchus contortus]|uniref:Reverse transcriptase domain-containing protein n=1 Tax=Haemonchus contortus TaxID=6289 RepID=A0A7I4Z788_HAECO
MSYAHRFEENFRHRCDRSGNWSSRQPGCSYSTYKVLRELYDNFTTRISPFYEEAIINVKGGVRQGDTISPKLFSAALENIMRHMEWESMGVTKHRAGGTNSLYTQVQKRIRSSEFRRRTKIRDAVDYAKRSKMRWANTLRDIVTVGPGRLRTRLSTRWSDFFT